jgi:phosphate transport system substrate-binding protein
MKRFIRNVAIGVAILAAAAVAKEVVVKGSDTLLNLVQRLAEEFGTTQPDVTVSVTGGGSGVGINALLNKETDIADASRGIKPEEVANAHKNGVNPTEFSIAIDGLSIIVNAKNPVTRLTKPQVGAIYRGEITNWKQVGGPDKKINLYGRQPSSGTFVFLREEVLEGEYAQSMVQMNGNAQIVEAVKGDPNGIGYVGVGYARSAQGVTLLNLAPEGSSSYVSPLETDKVLSGAYPLTRPLHQYTDGAPKDGAKAFIQYELSPAGQKIVEEEGFFPIGGGIKAHNDSILGAK